LSVSLPVRFELRPSLRTAFVILAAHGVAGACLHAVIGGGGGAALAGLVFALGMASAWDRAMLRGRTSPRVIELPGGDQGRVATADGRAIPIGQGPRAIHRFWLTLPLMAASRRTLFVTADMLEARQFRLLRLWALWGRLPGVAPGRQSG
jgi:hypothetical protein